MKTDKPLLAILLGAAAGPIVEVYTMLMKALGLTDITGAEAISMIWSTQPRLGWGIITAIVHFAWINLVIYYSVKVWGKDYFPLKAMLLAMTGESLVFNIFGILSGKELLIQTAAGNYVHASAAALGGALTGFFYQKFLYKQSRAAIKRERDILAFAAAESGLKTDQPLRAIVIGMIAMLITEAGTQLMKQFGLTTLSMMESFSLMWVKQPSLVLGVLSLVGIGAWINLGIYYSARWWGTEYFPLKAMVIAMAGEFLHLLIFGVLGGNALLVRDPVENFLHVGAIGMGGAMVGFLYQKYLFKEVGIGLRSRPRI